MNHIGDITMVNGAEITPVWCIYRLTSPDGLIYVGMTKNSISKRIENGYQHNARLREAGRKYGWRNFKHEVLESGLSFSAAQDREKHYIAIYNATNPAKGYNVSYGGKSTFEGLRHSEETRQRMSRAQQGKVKSAETRRRLSESNKGKHSGPLSPLYGKPKSPETIQKQYDSHRFQMRPVVQIDTSGEFVAEYCSVHGAARHIGVSKQALASCLRGKSKTCAGYVWKYKEVM